MERGTIGSRIRREVKNVIMKSNETALKTIGIRQLSVEVSLGLRLPVIIKAGEVYGDRPGKELRQLYRIKKKNIFREEQT